MSARRWTRVVSAIVVLALWAPATAFFAVVGLRVARETSGGHAITAPIADARGALITLAYSLGGAVFGLGLAWLALPRDGARGLRWAAALWLGVTALLLATRQVGGWPLLLAALIAVGIGIDVSRQLVLASFAAWREEPPSNTGV